MSDDRSDRELAVALVNASGGADVTEYHELVEEAVDRFIAEHISQSVTSLDDLPDGTDACEYVAVTFHPQAWRHDYAVAVDADGPRRFYVPTEDATDEDGTLYPDDNSQSDRLAHHENAPLWVRDWSGPFYVTIDR